MDNSGWWSKPVRIRIGHGTTRIAVTNTVQAATLLLEQWPGGAGPKHLAARKACVAVLEGKAPPARARRAFEAAAREADILG